MNEVVDRDPDLAAPGTPAPGGWYGMQSGAALAGRYRIERLISRGGMGAVYLATRADEEYNKRVAIKLVQAGSDRNAIIERFRHERQTLAALDHPNIVKLLDGGTTTDGVPFLVMDYVEGWFEGDAGRMERALHPELVKRCRGIEGDDPDVLETLSARAMIDATADGEGRREDAADRQIAIRIDHLSGGIASVQCFCHRYIDLLHLIEMPDGWKIINAAWRLR